MERRRWAGTDPGRHHGHLGVHRRRPPSQRRRRRLLVPRAITGSLHPHLRPSRQLPLPLHPAQGDARPRGRHLNHHQIGGLDGDPSLPARSASPTGLGVLRTISRLQAMLVFAQAALAGQFLSGHPAWPIAVSGLLVVATAPDRAGLRPPAGPPRPLGRRRVRPHRLATGRPLPGEESRYSSADAANQALNL